MVRVSSEEMAAKRDPMKPRFAPGGNHLYASDRNLLRRRKSYRPSLSSRVSIQARQIYARIFSGVVTGSRYAAAFLHHRRKEDPPGALRSTLAVRGQAGTESMVVTTEGPYEGAGRPLAQIAAQISSSRDPPSGEGPDEEPQMRASIGDCQEVTHGAVAIVKRRKIRAGRHGQFSPRRSMRKPGKLDPDCQCVRIDEAVSGKQTRAEQVRAGAAKNLAADAPLRVQVGRATAVRSGRANVSAKPVPFPGLISRRGAPRQWAVSFSACKQFETPCFQDGPPDRDHPSLVFQPTERIDCVSLWTPGQPTTASGGADHSHKSCLSHFSKNHARFFAVEGASGLRSRQGRFSARTGLIAGQVLQRSRRWRRAVALQGEKGKALRCSGKAFRPAPPRTPSLRACEQKTVRPETRGT